MPKTKESKPKAKAATKATTPDMRDLLDAIQAMPAPRSQAEWRAASTAMRSVRREADRRRYHCEPHIPVDGFRRRLCVAHMGGNAVYVGPSPIADIGMIAFNRHQHIAGIGRGRVADARVWAARSRAAGPVPLP